MGSGPRLVVEAGGVVQPLLDLLRGAELHAVMAKGAAAALERRRPADVESADAGDGRRFDDARVETGIPADSACTGEALAGGELEGADALPFRPAVYCGHRVLRTLWPAAERDAAQPRRGDSADLEFRVYLSGAGLLLGCDRVVRRACDLPARADAGGALGAPDIRLPVCGLLGGRTRDRGVELLFSLAEVARTAGRDRAGPPVPGSAQRNGAPGDRGDAAAADLSRADPRLLTADFGGGWCGSCTVLQGRPAVPAAARHSVAVQGALGAVCPGRRFCVVEPAVGALAPGVRRRGGVDTGGGGGGGRHAQLGLCVSRSAGGCGDYCTTRGRAVHGGAVGDCPAARDRLAELQRNVGRQLDVPVATEDATEPAALAMSSRPTESPKVNGRN